MKIVVNRCYGGFSLSGAAIIRFGELKGFTPYFYNLYQSDSRGDMYRNVKCARAPSLITGYYTVTKEYLGEKCDGKIVHAAEKIRDRDIPRNDPDLVRVVEELGDAANGAFAELNVIEIPDGVNWVIAEYDGMERVEEVHRSWPAQEGE